MCDGSVERTNRERVAAVRVRAALEPVLTVTLLNAKVVVGKTIRVPVGPSVGLAGPGLHVKVVHEHPFPWDTTVVPRRLAVLHHEKLALDRCVWKSKVVVTKVK